MALTEAEELELLELEEQESLGQEPIAAAPEQPQSTAEQLDKFSTGMYRGAQRVAGIPFMGAADNLAAGAEKGFAKVLPEFMGGMSSEDYQSVYGDRSNAELARTYMEQKERAKKESPAGFLTGEILTGGAMTGGLGFVPGAVAGGTLAAADAYGTTEGDILDKAKNAAEAGIYSTGLSVAGGKAIDAAGDMIQNVPGALKNLANTQAFRSLGIQKKDAKRLLQDSNKFDRVAQRLYDEDVIGFGSSYESIRDKLADRLTKHGLDIESAVKEADDIISKNPDLAKYQFDVDEFVNQARSRVVDPMKTNANFMTQAPKVESVISGYDVLHKGQKLPLEKAWNYRQQMDQGIDWDALGNAPVVKKGVADVRNIMEEPIAGGVEGALAAGGSPNVNQYLSAKKAYGELATAAPVIENKVAGQLANRTVSPSDYAMGLGGVLQQSVKNPGSSNVEDGLKATLFAMGHKMVRERGSSAIGVTANKLSKLTSILNSPAASQLGEYAAPLMNAMQRGSNALSATHFTLMQNDPKYREMMNQP